MKKSKNKIYKVIVWATGGIGKSAIRTITDRDNMQLVGVWVHSESKEGKDAGELAEMNQELGIRATRDVDALLALDADCVVYVAPAAVAKLIVLRRESVSPEYGAKPSWKSDSSSSCHPGSTRTRCALTWRPSTLTIFTSRT